MSTVTLTSWLFLQAFSKLVSCTDAVPLSEAVLITANTCFVTRELDITFKKETSKLENSQNPVCPLQRSDEVLLPSGVMVQEERAVGR